MAEKSAGSRKSRKAAAQPSLPSLDECRRLFLDAVSKRDKAWQDLENLRRGHEQAVREIEAWRTIAYGAYRVDLLQESQAPVDPLPPMSQGDSPGQESLDAATAPVVDLIVEYFRRHVVGGPLTPKQVHEGIQREFGRALSTSAVIVTRDRHKDRFKKVPSPRGAFILVEDPQQ